MDFRLKYGRKVFMKIRYYLFLICCFTTLYYIPATAEPLDRVVAIVNDDIISQTEVDEQVDAIKHQMLQSKMTLPPEKVLKKQVLSRLIDRDLQLQLAEKLGIKTDDAHLNKMLKSIAERNHLTVSQLRQQVEKGGVKYDQYLDTIRKEITIGELQRKAISQQISISNQEIDAFLKKHQAELRKNTYFHVQDIVISTPDEPSSKQIATAQKEAETIMKALRKGADFDRITVTYSSDELALSEGDLGWRKLTDLPIVFAKKLTKMKPGDIAGPVRTSNGFHIIKLQATRDPQENQKATVTHLKQILIKTNELTSSQEAKTKLLKIRKQLQKGASFAALAKQNSQDLTSSEKGGDLGWIYPDKIVPVVMLEMNKLKINEYSKPIKSQFGWHLIQVLGRRTVDASQHLARQKARQFLFRQKFEKSIKTWLKQLRDQSYIKVIMNA